MAYLEELLWTCECGTAMGLELLSSSGGHLDLDCRQCGIVGSVRIRVSKAILVAPDQPTKPKGVKRSSQGICR
jgi:uncharacterized Zn finger protein